MTGCGAVAKTGRPGGEGTRALSAARDRNDGLARRLACAALLAAAVAAPASAAERKALVQGVDDRALAAQLQRAVGESRNPPANRLEARRRAREAAEAIESLLRSEGWYDAEITPDIGEGEHPQATVKIVLGARTLIASTQVAFSDPPPEPTARLGAAAAASLDRGAPGRAADVLAAEGRALAQLQSLGYADAKSEPREVFVDHADNSMRPVFHIASGGIVRMDGLKLDRIGRVNPAWVRNLVPWSPGDLYRPDDVAELERRLQDTQVFDTTAVALAPENNAEGLRPVSISLTDRPPRFLDFSAGYSTTEGADFDLRFTRYNLLRRADTLTLQARLAQLDSRYGGELSLPHWRRPGQTLRASAYYLDTNTDAYIETGEQVSSDITRRYGKTSFVTLGGSFTNTRVDDRHTPRIDIQTSRVFGAFLLDRTDAPLDAKHGWKLDARAAPTAVTGDISAVYVKAIAQGSAYFAFDKEAANVVAVRARLGSILGGSVGAVPISDRFFAGGGGSVRGYEYQSIGPAFPDGSPRGGLSLFEASAEFRRRIGKTPFSAVAFVDAGAVGTDVYPDFSGLSPAVGLGVRFALPFAPIRMDVATPLRNPPGRNLQPIQIYLSIGQSF